MSRAADDDNRALKRQRKLNRMFGGEPPEKCPLSEEVLADLRKKGHVDEEGKLTPAGELRLHQLELLEYWVRVAQPRREGQRAKQKALHNIASALKVSSDTAGKLLALHGLQIKVEKVRTL